MLSEAVRGIIARGAFAAALSIAAGVLSACASTSYAGIPLTAGAADAELQDLARRAQAEDKHAQLELGIRYEEGRGVAPDFRRASKLYRSAATTTALSTSYSLPQGRGGSTSAGVLYSGAVSAGLPYALARFCSLEVPRTERESVLCKKARPEDVDEVLLVASYEVNFAGCTRKVKFGPFSRNEFRAVRNCLVQESRASRCEQDLATALRKVQALVWGTGRLAHLRQPARVLTEVCPGTHRQF
jgi:hypothetical protein